MKEQRFIYQAGHHNRAGTATGAQRGRNMDININDEIIGRANGLRRGPIEIAAQDWPEACRQASEGEWIDAAAPDCPDDDGAGWYPLIYHCAAGEWAGRMTRVEG